MVLENEILPYWQWLFVGPEGDIGSLWWFLIVVVSLSFVSLLVGYLITAVRFGPLTAGDMTYRVVSNGLKEILSVSPRRVTALARLAIQESIRRRVVVAFAVFLIILLFASWFLGINNPEPAKLYLSFVLTATTYLVLLLSLFLSAFSLPNDFKHKTIYTIVTKPVRAGEIVLGRIIGFSIIGTVMLAAMGLCSYLFVVRSLNHTHDVDVFNLTDIESGEGTIGKKGRTTLDAFHRHELTIGEDGTARTEAVHSHWHEIRTDKSSGAAKYLVSGPQDMFRARVPVYGKLRFKDRTGQDKALGINVGNEWAYRSFIDGATQAAAIWTFDNIYEETYPRGLPLELVIRVFRTHKGIIEEGDTGRARGILGSIVVRNPLPDPITQIQIASDVITFQAKDAFIDSKPIPRDLTDSQGNPLDLFKDLVRDGKVEIVVQCLEPGQYFGMAQADCYMRPSDGWFEANFFKGYVSIWVQMVLVTGVGVMCSTILSGPVAMMFTLSILVIGFFKTFIISVAKGDTQGGGPIESLVRLVTQKNLTVQLEEGVATLALKAFDAVSLVFMQAFASMMPDFRDLSTVGHVTDGFNISTNLMAQHLTTCLAYLIGFFVIGYFLLRAREVAK